MPPSPIREAATRSASSSVSLEAAERRICFAAALVTVNIRGLRLYNAGGSFRVRPAATTARNSSSARRASTSARAAASSSTSAALHFRLRGERPLHRCKQLRRQMNGGAHDGWNINLFESVQRNSLRTFRILSPTTTRPGSTTFALMPRRQSFFPRREFANFIASTPNRAANFLHPRWGIAVTSMIARSQRQPGARRQVLLAEIQIDEELIASERPSFPGLRHQGDKPANSSG